MRGSMPSIDIANANLDVPMVGDSSAPNIENMAPATRTRPPRSEGLRPAYISVRDASISLRRIKNKRKRGHCVAYSHGRTSRLLGSKS
jgi:hypothetical protein